MVAGMLWAVTVAVEVVVWLVVWAGTMAMAPGVVSSVLWVGAWAPGGVSRVFRAVPLPSMPVVAFWAMPMHGPMSMAPGEVSMVWVWAVSVWTMEAGVVVGGRRGWTGRVEGRVGVSVAEVRVAWQGVVRGRMVVGTMAWLIVQAGI